MRTKCLLTVFFVFSSQMPKHVCIKYVSPLSRGILWHLQTKAHRVGKKEGPWVSEISTAWLLLEEHVSET
jgi:hypothetical protein